MIALERALHVSRGLLCRLLPRAHVLTSLGEHVAPHLGPTHLSLHCCRRLRLLRIPAQYAAAVGAHRRRELRLRDEVRRGAGLSRVLDGARGTGPKRKKRKLARGENVRTARACHRLSAYGLPWGAGLWAAPAAAEGGEAGEAGGRAGTSEARGETTGDDGGDDDERRLSYRGREHR